MARGLTEVIGDAADDRADRVGGDGHDDDLGAVERGRCLGVAEGGHPRRQGDAEPRVRVPAIERLDDGASRSVPQRRSS